jgi:LuxR family maltose regulon positive regulatory protein
MNLGIVEAWALGNEDSERHLREGADLARDIGRPYLEAACLAQLGFASKIGPFARTRRLCREAIALAERHGWGTEPIIAPALVALAAALIWAGELGEGEGLLQRAVRALETDTGPGIRLLLHLATGMLCAGRSRHHEALAEFSAAERLQSQLTGSHALANQLTGWRLATQVRAGLVAEARASLAEIAEQRASAGEIRNACAAIDLADGAPARALAEAQAVVDGTAPVIGFTTVIQAHLLAGLAHRELGDRHAASQAAEHALALAEPDRLVLPFAITGSRELLETIAPYDTAHAALLADILGFLHGSSVPPSGQPTMPPTEQLSPSELRVLGYLPTNLSRPEIASELSVSVNTVNTHIRSIYAKLQAQNRSSAVQRARELRLLSGGITR